MAELHVKRVEGLRAGRLLFSEKALAKRGHSEINQGMQLLRTGTAFRYGPSHSNSVKRCTCPANHYPPKDYHAVAGISANECVFRTRRVEISTQRGRIGRMTMSVTSAVAGSFNAATTMLATSPGRISQPYGGVRCSIASILRCIGVSVRPGKMLIGRVCLHCSLPAAMRPPLLPSMHALFAE